MKYVVVASLIILLLLVVYSRVRPYIQFVNKILGRMKAVTDERKTNARSRRQSAGLVDSKLVRCVSCGTWVPAERAIGAGSGSSIYCSRECLEKPKENQERKIAG